MQKMGMSVAQLPGGEIVPAMERGVIDAFEFNNRRPTAVSAPRTWPRTTTCPRTIRPARASSSCSTRTSTTISTRTCGRSEYAVEAASTNPRRDGQLFEGPVGTADQRGVTVHGPRRTSWTPSSRPGTRSSRPREGSVHEEGARQPAYLGRPGRVLRTDERADYALAYDHYFPGKLKL